MPHKENQDKKYTCPMHSEIQSDQPGMCPKCGMQLIEKDQNDEQKEM